MRTSLSRSMAACVLGCLLLLSGCASLPPLDKRTDSHALIDTADTRLGRLAAPLAAQNPGKTGVIGFPDGRAAFGLRLELARAASRSIDIQTFVWHADAAGMLLFDEMIRAAERGVRVRLLLDDANTMGMDPVLALLSAQSNLEVRLYNPYVERRSRMLAMLGDFRRLNHRMHNKSFTVDNQVAVVGGRNIANEYFEAGQDLSFADIDVLAIGAAVPAVSGEFDLFWNSASAYPAALVIDPTQALDRAQFAQRVRDIIDSPKAAKYVEAIARSTQLRGLTDGTSNFEWTRVQVVHDDPQKTLRPDTATELHLLPKLQAAFIGATSALDLVSPYFVPGEEGTATLMALARRGVRVRVLTNSLASTDVTAVHAGYAKRRKDLLTAGVQLFEFKPGAAEIHRHVIEIGSSASAGLHAKTFAVDNRLVFVGSFNLDPRSSKLNTEMGLLIDSATLAGNLSTVINRSSPDLAYKVTLAEDGQLRWLDGVGPPLDIEPGTGWGLRMLVHILGWLPIEWLL